MKRKSLVRDPAILPPPIAPGEILNDQWLRPADMSQSELARRMGVHVQVVNGIVQNRRAITARTAILLSRALPPSSAQFWMNLQAQWDLWHAAQDLTG
jgi:addiction module HigA family antidote